MTIHKLVLAVCLLATMAHGQLCPTADGTVTATSKGMNSDNVVTVMAGRKIKITCSIDITDYTDSEDLVAGFYIDGRPAGWSKAKITKFPGISLRRTEDTANGLVWWGLQASRASKLMKKVITEEITIETARNALSGESYDIYCGYGFDLQYDICAEDMVTINVVSRGHRVKGGKHNTPSPTSATIGGTTPAPTIATGTTPAPTIAKVGSGKPSASPTTAPTRATDPTTQPSASPTSQPTVYLNLTQYALMPNVTSGLWSSVAVSSNGSIVLASQNGGYLYTSTDGGQSWLIAQTYGTILRRAWTGVAMSSSGGALFAVQGTQLYVSTDFGAMWFGRNTPIAGYGTRTITTSIASSSNGTILAATTVNNIYVSSNSGDTWSAKLAAENGSWSDICMSSDGMVLIASLAYGNNSLVKSIDGGSTWSKLTSAGAYNWNTVACSVDANIVVAGAWNGFLVTSKDGGASWTNHSSNGMYGNWIATAVSGDGSVITALMQGEYIWTSLNQGTTFNKLNFIGRCGWSAVALNSNGLMPWVAISGGSLFGNTGEIMSISQVSSLLNSLPSGRRLMPSSLIQSSDITTAATTTRALQPLGTPAPEPSAPNGGHPFNHPFFVSGGPPSVASALYDSSLQTYLVAIRGVNGQLLMANRTNKDDLSTRTWINGSVRGDWSSCTMSKNGTVMVATKTGGIYISRNWGTTWVQSYYEENSKWASIDSSDDGSILVAVQEGSFLAAYIYISTDIGNSWEQKSPSNPASTGFSSVAMSGDASFIVAAEIRGYIYKSTDLGRTWSHILGDNTRWASVAMDSSGSLLIAAPAYGFIQRSNDTGATWENFSPFQANWASISATIHFGPLVAAVTTDGQMYSVRRAYGSFAWQLSYQDQGTTFTSVARAGYEVFAGGYQKRNPRSDRTVLVTEDSINFITTATNDQQPAPSGSSPTPNPISNRQREGCFSADDTATMKDGSNKSLADLNVGEEILTLSAKGVLEFSPVVFLPRESPNFIPASFIKVVTADGESIQMTHDHLVAFEEQCEEGNASANGVGASSLRRANEVHKGGCLYITSSDNKSLILKRVAEIDHVEKEGVYTAVAMNPYLVRICTLAFPLSFLKKQKSGIAEFRPQMILSS